MLSIKKLLKTVILVSIIGLASAPAMALNSSLIILNVDPMVQNRFIGDEVFVNLLISGLEFEDLSTFDLNLSYVVGDQLGVLAASPGFVQSNPVPVPANALLLSSGLIGLVGIRRRSRP